MNLGKILFYLLWTFWIGDTGLRAQTTESWILTGGEAKSILANSLVLDTRSLSVFYREHIAGSRSIAWEEFSQPSLPAKGNLLSPEVLKKKLESLGVRDDRPVLVIGEPKNGWGEDGRIVWMLRSLGHRTSFLVDGGYETLKRLGAPVSNAGEPKKIGSFRSKPDPSFTATKEEIKANLKNKKYLFLDTREEREFRGETPYGESRGGHIPGAAHLYYKNLIKSDGNLVSSGEISDRLKKLGADRDTTIVAYCTGGIRSAWITAVLRNEGFKAKNYAGSMWEWSAGNDREFPLVGK